MFVTWNFPVHSERIFILRNVLLGWGWRWSYLCGTLGAGGIGGGGGQTYQPTANGGSAITVPTNYYDGAPNSGAGGGGTWVNNIGSGGSGIVVVAFPATPVSTASA